MPLSKTSNQHWPNGWSKTSHHCIPTIVAGYILFPYYLCFVQYWSIAKWTSMSENQRLAAQLNGSRNDKKLLQRHGKHLRVVKPRVAARFQHVSFMKMSRHMPTAQPKTTTRTNWCSLATTDSRKNVRLGADQWGVVTPYYPCKRPQPVLVRHTLHTSNFS